MNFQDQIVIVTGASRGIGRSVAQQFAELGARVACIASSEANGQKAAEAVGHDAKGYGCDVGSSEAVEATFERIVAEMGTPSVLVNNAGITRDNLMLRLKDEDWEDVIRVNLKGTYLCIKAAMRPMMKARYGRIVNVSSVVGLGGAAGQANYAASKAGLVGLTKSVAKELGSRGITCNAVAPGFVETDMTEGLTEEFRKKVIETAPAGRLGEPADIAPAIVFLASREAGYITGQTLVVDGGLTL